MRHRVRASFAACRLLSVGLVASAARPHRHPAPAARAASSYYANTSTGSDSNNCLSASTPCKTIGAALGKAGSGDVVNVAAGLYVEHPTISKAVTLVGAGDGNTTIDPAATASAPFSALTVNLPAANSDQTVRLSGLTISGGWSKFGGGVSLWGGDLTITDATITNNTAGGIAASTGGGGIGVLGRIFGTTQHLTLNNVTVSNNKTVTSTSGTTTTSYPGAGMYAAGPVTVNNSRFTGNSTGGSTFGGAVHLVKIVAADTPNLTADATSFVNNSSVAGSALSVSGGTNASLLHGSSIDANTGTSGIGVVQRRYYFDHRLLRDEQSGRVPGWRLLQRRRAHALQRSGIGELCTQRGRRHPPTRRVGRHSDRIDHHRKPSAVWRRGIPRGRGDSHHVEYLRRQQHRH